MAVTKTCDLCGKPAISEISSKSTTTTEVKVDVCESHLLEYKVIMRDFIGQESLSIGKQLDKAIKVLVYKEEDVSKSDS